MKLPVDTSAIAFLCAMPPEPVVDFETRRPKADENGEPLYVVQLLAMGDGSADLLPVKVPGVPSSAIRQGAPVKVAGLVAQPWTMADRGLVPGRSDRASDGCGEGELTEGRDARDRSGGTTEGPADRLLGAGPAPPPDDQVRQHLACTKWSPDAPPS